MCKRLRHKGNVVITFNYDLIMDVSIKNYLSRNESNGYGFREHELLRDVETVKESELVLLRPHCSLNWFRRLRIEP